MSQPRVTITVGRNGKVLQRRATVSRDMYSDQINGGSGNNRKRSVRDRLGGAVEQSSSVGRTSAPKRQRLEEGKWKHDLYDDKEEGELLQTNGRSLTEDLRSLLARRSVARSGQSDMGSVGGVTDLREKLSGPIPGPKADRPAILQRRVASVVRGNSGLASLGTLRPGTRSIASTQKAPVSHLPPAQKTVSEWVEPQTVAGLLQSLGLSKYLITFQSEEVDMEALRHMSDDDLKELGVPMGPRKKILLSVASQL